MAFRPINLSKLNSTPNPVLNPSGSQIKGASAYTYNTAEDALATVSGASYFNIANPKTTDYGLLTPKFAVGDLIWAHATDGNVFLQVTAAGSTVTTTVYSTILDGSIVTADLANSAVTNAKLNADVAGTYITGGAGSALEIADVVSRSVTVTVSAAEIIAMYTTPKLLVAAGGANTMHILNNALLEVDYGTAQFTGGGVVAIQYDSTANGAGTDASADLAAATLNGYTADSVVMLAGEVPSVASSTTVNKGLYLSNETGVFANGDSTVYVHLNYYTVTTTV